MITSNTNKPAATATYKSVARNELSLNLPDQRIQQRRELLNHVYNLTERASKLQANQIKQRDTIVRTISLRKAQNHHTPSPMVEKRALQSHSPHKTNEIVYTPKLDQQSNRSCRDSKNLKFKSPYRINLRKWGNDNVTPHIHLTGEQHNSLHDHDDHTLAPTTQVSLLPLDPPTVSQSEDKIKCLVREHEVRVASSITLLEYENDTTTNGAVDTIRDSIEYFANFMYNLEQYHATTSTCDMEQRNAPLNILPHSNRNG